jgi:hypothetical protein
VGLGFLVFFQRLRQNYPSLSNVIGGSALWPGLKYEMTFLPKADPLNLLLVMDQKEHKHNTNTKSPPKYVFER